MLYLAVDAAYPFNDDYLDRNPMVKLPVESDTVSYFG